MDFLAGKGGLHCEHMGSQRSITKNVAADAVHDSMSLDVWWHLQHLVELLLGNLRPQCPLKNSTADTAFGRKMALQDVLLVFANSGKCIICPGLLANGSALLPRNRSSQRCLENGQIWEVKWMEESCAITAWFLVLLVFMSENFLGPSCPTVQLFFTGFVPQGCLI